jgi:enoyl-[acyl-carrier protein] reductase I
MTEGGSVMAMTYYGSEKVVPGYNIMGVAKASLECTVRYLASSVGPKNIRVNAISAGPIKTLAARGIGGFTDMLKVNAERAPLRRNVTQEEVGDLAAFLAADTAAAITGEVIHIDCGSNIVAG